VIGFKKATISNESGVRIRQNDIMRRFSIDKSGQIYRVEVYKQDKFSGMVLVNFSKNREDFVASGPSKVSLLEVSELRNPPSSEDSSIRAEQDSSLSR
jgi:hypothetical protein